MGARKILIVDPQIEEVRPLSRALRQQGYQVIYAPDGSRALELAVLRYPDLIIFAEDSPLVSARTFAQILQTNPRTEQIPLIRSVGPHADERLRQREGTLKKPFEIQEVIRRLEVAFRKADTARALKSEAKEIEGILTQLPLADLLQVLAMNRRSGRLNLQRGAEQGEIFLGAGRPLNARVHAVEGDKALFRLLSWMDGSFSFVPGAPTATVRIERNMDEAVLEGLRQTDELQRLWPSLPPKHAHVHWAPDASLPDDQHPVTAQVVELAREARTVGELVDLSTATDLDTLSALTSLMQCGAIRVAHPPTDDGPAPLLGPAEIHALRARVLRGRTETRVAVAKVFVCGAAAVSFRRVTSEVPGAVAIAAKPLALQSHFGTVATLALDATVRVDFCLLPAVSAAAPLWRPFSNGAVGVLLFEAVDPHLGLARYLAFEERIPVVVMGGPVPPMLAHAPAGSASVGDHVEEALRALLVQALNPVVPLDPSAAAESWS